MNTVSHSKQKMSVSLTTATLLVVANCIGTGIFTTSGFALADLKNPYSVLGLWVFGAFYSLVGVSCYQELHHIYPGSGGEYHFLSRGWHRWLGYLAGWITLIAGFAAPLAAGAMAFSIYLKGAIHLDFNPLVVSTMALFAVFFMHMFLLNMGRKIHDIITWGKLIGVSLLVIIPCFFVDWRWPQVSSAAEFSFSRLANSFFWIAFAFSGWNAVYYIASEVGQSSEDVRKSSLWGTAGVAILYVAINVLLVFGTDVSSLEGVPDVVAKFLENIFGTLASRCLAFLISFGLLSTLSAFFITGPRVYSRMAEDGALPKLFYTPDGILPKNAIVLQLFVSLVILWSLQFDKILSMAGFILTVCSALAVSVLLIKIPATRVKFYMALFFTLVTFWLAFKAAPEIFSIPGAG